MKNIIALSIGLFFSLASAAPPAGQSYALKWSDEFDGTVLDTNNWSFEVGGQGGAEAEYYTNGANLTIENGAAVLWAKKEDFSNYHYTSCWMKTEGKREFKYGYIEVRLKAPYGYGPLSAFWMLGANYPVVPWPDCGEIELYQQQTGPQLHYGTPGDNCFLAACDFKGASGGVSYNTKQYDYTGCLCNDYHLYAIEWDSLGISFFFDGQKFWEYDTINASYNFASFHQPHFFIANIAILAPDTTIFPQRMYIDYVRVYQKSTQTVANHPKRTLESMTLLNPSKVQLRVYDTQGRLIADYTDRVRRLKPGENVMKGIASDLPIGIYVTRLFDGVKTVSEKMVIQK